MPAAEIAQCAQSDDPHRPPHGGAVVPDGAVVVLIPLLIMGILYLRASVMLAHANARRLTAAEIELRKLRWLADQQNNDRDRGSPFRRTYK